jgi:hypothetical protein
VKTIWEASSGSFSAKPEKTGNFGMGLTLAIDVAREHACISPKRLQRDSAYWNLYSPATSADVVRGKQCQQHLCRRYIMDRILDIRASSGFMVESVRGPGRGQHS